MAVENVETMPEESSFSSRYYELFDESFVTSIKII